MHRGNEPVVEAMGRKFIAIEVDSDECGECAGNLPGADMLCGRLPVCERQDEEGNSTNLIFKEVA